MKKTKSVDPGVRFNSLVSTGKLVNSNDISELNEKGRWLSEFKCDCGKICYLRQSDVISGKRKSCGHGNTSFEYKKMKSSFGEDYGYRVLHKKFEHNAKKRNILFTITIEDIKHMFIEQKGLCYYSGSLIKMPNNFIDIYEPDIASIDRTDSSKGYITDNVRLVHKSVNMMKQNLSEESFISYCKLIADNFK